MRRPRVLPRCLAVAALAACGAGKPAAPAPRWVDLSREFRPRPLEELARLLEEQVRPPRGGRVVRAETDGAEVWFELPLPRAAWTRDEESGGWQAPRPAGGAFLAAVPGTLIVAHGTRTWKQRGTRHTARRDLPMSVIPDPGTELPETLTCRVRLDAGRASDGRWRAAEKDLACDGFLVFPGLPERLTVEVPPAGVLSFASVSPDPDGRGEALAPTTFRVRLDGRVIHEHVQAFALPVRSSWQRIALETSGPHELTFEIEGQAPALIATPRLQPSEVGRPLARPWSDARPDLLLVLCDTFRADNLAAWGGRPELAPRLNRFVERSVRFLDARATANWTLPSIGSILTGVHPGQHGGTDMDRAVLPEVESIAEVLARAGYRTAAVTDAGFFSRFFGQDQGFEWFEEVPLKRWSLEDTLARAEARMSADDGRPLFLVVHTYRVHGPMRVGPTEDAEPARESHAAFLRGLEERRQSGEEVNERKLLLEFVSTEGKRIYEDAVADLDRKLGAWLEELEGGGFFERANLLLTADHGNSRGEHGRIGHGGILYDVELRVPLAIAGRGITPRAVLGPTSLVDVAPTFAALAGASSSPTWIGRSLLERDPAGPIYAFDLANKGEHVAIYSGSRKVLGRGIRKLQEGEPSLAFDLERDPGEDDDLAADEAWPAELGRSLADALDPMLVPLGTGGSIELSEEALKELRDLGYGR